MKITKLIREYVTEQVSKVYDTKENPYSKQAELDRQKLKEFENELKLQQRSAIEKFISENELFTDRWTGLEQATVGSIGTSTPCISHHLTRAMLDEKKWKEENIKAKNHKIRDIMLSLELGATRQELNDMISKLMEDTND